ncbi:MAG TPA: ribosome recycling factor [bacterium]|nr:ribosome recycling factor [bacterium]HOL46887.1 ribosome recycling factor [bacterium]HPQ18764.1 ribosome recycling factor [bacterium]
MLDDILNETRRKMNKSIENFQKELITIRTGKATPALLETIKVDYYGTKTPITQMANISVPEPRTMIIKPWDASQLENIKKAIQTSSLGITPQDDGKIIRLIFPPLSEESRKNLIKIVKTKGEETKIAIRNIRRESNELVDELEKEKEITEDEAKTGKKKIQDITDEFIKKVDEIIKIKEDSIMEV